MPEIIHSTLLVCQTWPTSFHGICSHLQTVDWRMQEIGFILQFTISMDHPGCPTNTPSELTNGLRPIPVNSLEISNPCITSSIFTTFFHILIVQYLTFFSLFLGWTISPGFKPIVVHEDPQVSDNRTTIAVVVTVVVIVVVGSAVGVFISLYVS